MFNKLNSQKNSNNEQYLWKNVRYSAILAFKYVFMYI